MAVVTLGDLRYTFGTFPVIWGMLVQCYIAIVEPVVDFAVLNKASEQLRSLVYVFIIVSLAVLLYGLNAYAYPKRQFIYDDINFQVRCRYNPELVDTEKCFQGSAAVEDKQLPSLDKDIEKNLWGHELQLFYDDSVALRTFKFPIFGLETDRDLLWLIFPLIGIIGYYFVWLALGRLVGMFRFLLDHKRTDAVRLRLIQSSLMITTPLSSELGEVSPFYRVGWRALAVSVFAIPIIISLLTIADQTNAIAVFIRRVNGSVLVKQTDGLLAQLIFEITVLLLQLGLFGKLIALGRRFGRDQSEAERLVKTLEAQGSDSLDIALRQRG